ncbi:5-oxoprolinase subunit PxpB [Paenibacillus sp. NEAU-GSW1]|uniref:5-oxoprolinase subunit PxpB n=1 Tax=Paenibacillus sp. NEAU-GSW1 TaxID=2682486 RepID=UPI0012E2C995|nr:5-oxoprolinase subunit PxpB [Paenibacillus sp. NEAU-GSW1]MUT67127.1 5-oxoprolinase subunit PxpB [Paenibacillus sp. NEAU-GSW1]
MKRTYKLLHAYIDGAGTVYIVATGHSNKYWLRGKGYTVMPTLKKKREGYLHYSYTASLANKHLICKKQTAGGSGMGLEITPLGDRALVLHSGGEGAGTDGWREMAALAERIGQKTSAWAIDIVPAYDTVTVLYDPSALIRLAKREQKAPTAGGDRAGEKELLPFQIAELLIRKIASETRKRASDSETLRIVEVPVVYGGECGPDLAEASERAGLSTEAFIRLHSEAEYTVAMLGFMPGFPYLSGLPAQLEQPRKASPRSAVPEGSVGIAGIQTGIYPMETPGGWQLIGRTSLKLFDFDREQPALLKAGDLVKFVRVERLGQDEHDTSKYCRLRTE